ncbi:hypothetical protein [Nocardia alni]|uniref:hypothetical protein n=1 Tax=Nocardia alni TaxID=2815723 RepID=UPI001C24153C|nr:hypothetical protein [Nocardia alni]
MTIHIGDWLMTSDRTDEQACRVAEKWEASWRLSWLPERLVTRAQALAGMDLAETYDREDVRHDRLVRARALVHAAELGLTLDLALLELGIRRCA